MSRLVVLSNRVKMPDGSPMAGGLAVALDDVLKGRSVIWMGWNGQIDEAGSGNEFSQQQTTLASANKQEADTQISYVTTALTPKQYQHYYCGFANSVLWLLLHEQPHLISQAPDDYTGYQQVNRLFARQLQQTIQPDDVIWVHDYHFLSVAYYCRKLGMNNRIGFFFHIPFAPLEFWQPLNQSPELIYHLAHYDLLGTQTEQDKANCLAVLQHYLKDRLCQDAPLKDRFLVNSDLQNSAMNSSYTKQNFTQASGTSVPLAFNLDLDTTHYLNINAYPIGVNVAKIQEQVSHLSAVNDTQKNVVKPTAQQIIAVDRIDYSKGLLARFSAYRVFLEHNPQYQNQLSFLQIACPSRLDLPVYQQLYDEVKRTVDDVNQRFSFNKSISHSADCLHWATAKAGHFKINRAKAVTCKCSSAKNNWQAITYSETVLNHDKLMIAFYHSDVGWVNSLKDGMNLVAKEYIAAQNPDNPGVLLLSRYAGAAAQMQAAVIIDPQRPDSIIQGLKMALTLPLAERKSRYQTLLKGLQDYDIHAWQQDFLDDLYSSRHSSIKQNA